MKCFARRVFNRLLDQSGLVRTRGVRCVIEHK